MSLTLKIGSLFIRTLAKPIGNYIKRNASEHERFRHIAVGFAQRLHRFDMRLRLGLLQDPAVIDRQIAKEVAEAEARRKAAHTTPTVPTQAESKAEETAKQAEKRRIREDKEKARARIRIRPLSEAKAIETGANFISETFMFVVAGGIILFESWRSRRKESDRRDMVSERLENLEEKITTLETELVEEKRKNGTLAITSEEKLKTEVKEKTNAQDAKIDSKDASKPASA